MSDSYERIQDQADVQFQFLRAGILLEQESFFSTDEFNDKKKFPKHLHVLVPKGQNQALAAASQWQGVLHAVKHSIHEQVQRLCYGSGVQTAPSPNPPPLLSRMTVRLGPDR